MNLKDKFYLYLFDKPQEVELTNSPNELLSKSWHLAGYFLTDSSLKELSSLSKDKKQELLHKLESVE